jgi:Amt family ammonium transporter
MLSWTLIDWLKHGKPTAIGAISGAVAGLVCITPAAGFVTPMSALIIGFIAGGVCYLMVVEVKKIFGYDDTLDVFGIHGVGGAVGAIATGVFATASVNPIFKDAAVGLADGNASQILNQLAGILIAAALAALGTLVILKLVDLAIGLRVSKRDEITGLDATQHGEIAYVFETPSAEQENRLKPARGLSTISIPVAPSRQS